MLQRSLNRAGRRTEWEIRGARRLGQTGRDRTAGLAQWEGRAQTTGARAAVWGVHRASPVLLRRHFYFRQGVSLVRNRPGASPRNRMVLGLKNFLRAQGCHSRSSQGGLVWLMRFCFCFPGRLFFSRLRHSLCRELARHPIFFNDPGTIGPELKAQPHSKPRKVSLGMWEVLGLSSIPIVL